METELAFKIVVIGAVGVGKSSLTMRYVNNDFNDKLDSTLGAVYLEKNITIKNKKIKLEFWDTAGQERYKAIARIYYKDCRAAVVLYDVSSRASFEELKKWVEELKNNAPEDILMAIVGNKIDLEQQSVGYEQVKQYADQLGAILKYTSAKDGKGVEQLFQAIAEQLMSRDQQEKQLRKSKVLTGKPKKEKKACC